MAVSNEGFTVDIDARIDKFNAKLAEARKNLEKFQREAGGVRVAGGTTGTASVGGAATTNATRKFTASVYSMGAAVDSATRALVRFSATLGVSRVRAGASASSMAAAATRGASGASGGGLGSLALGMVPTAAVLAAGAGVPIYKGLQEYGSREKLRTDLGTLMRSDEGGAAMAGKLQAYAGSTPYSQNDLAGTAKLLLQYGSSADETEKLIKQLGDIALGNGQAMNSLGLVLGQVKSAGALKGQDLMQFINAGFNPLSVLSEMTGESMADLKDAASEGKITFDMVAAALEHATSEGGQFYKGAERGSKTLQGLASTISDNLGTALAKIIESQDGALKDLADSWAKFDWSQVVSVGSDFFALVIDGFTTVSNIMQEIGQHAEAMKQVAEAMAAAAAAMAEYKLLECLGAFKSGSLDIADMAKNATNLGASALKANVALMGITWGLTQIARLGSAIWELFTSGKSTKETLKQMQERSNVMKSLGMAYNNYKTGKTSEEKYQQVYQLAQKTTGDLTGSMYDVWTKPEEAAKTETAKETKRTQTLVIDKSKKEIKQTNNIKVDESRFAKVVKDNLEMLLTSHMRIDSELTGMQANAG